MTAVLSVKKLKHFTICNIFYKAIIKTYVEPSGLLSKKIPELFAAQLCTACMYYKKFYVLQIMKYAVVEVASGSCT